MADDAKRIAELEARVRELTHLVEELAREHVETRPEAAEEAQGLIRTASIAAERARQALVRDVRVGVERALGGPAQAPLESRIGAIWLGRLAMVALMTSLVLGAALTSQWQALGEVQKVAIGYGVAAAFIIYGLFSHGSPYLFPKTVLGAGLALVYFTTYAAFFVDAMQLFPNRAYAIPALLACLLAILGIAHERRSKAATGIALFLVYYTVLLSSVASTSPTATLYALGTSAVLALAAFLFHLLHRWMFLTWSALLATYFAYGYFFLRHPAGAADSVPLFWWSNGFLTLCFLLFSLAFVFDTRRGTQGARTAPFLAALNAILYIALTWSAFQSAYPAHDWAYRFALAGLFVLLAAAAEWSGTHRGRMVHLFAVFALVSFTLALESVLEGPELALALAIESVALALLYAVTATPLWKLLGVPLLGIVTAAGIYTLQIQGTLSLGPRLIPLRWAVTGVLAGALILAALLYERVAWRVRANRGRTVASQGWPTDTRASLLHALAPAFLVLLLLILDFGGHPWLPYALGACAAGCALAAVLLRLPQLCLAALLLTLAAHAGFHVLHRLSLLPETPGLIHALVLPALLALLAVLLGPLWNRYLRATGAQAAHGHLLGAIPYIVGGFMAITLAWMHLGMLEQLVAQQALGAVLVGTAVLTGSLPFLIAAAAVIAVAATQLTHVLVLLPRLLPVEGLVASALGLVALLIAGERACAWSAAQGRLPWQRTNLFRMAFVAAAVPVALAGIYRTVPAHLITASWLAAALILLGLGLASHAGAYRWGALAAILAAVARGFAHDLTNLSPTGSVLSFMVLAFVLLFVSWIYSRSRNNGSRPGHAEAPDGRRTPGGS